MADGAREVWLTSQDMACYGLDAGIDLVKLLQAVCSLHSDFWARVGMMNPRFVLPFLDDLVDMFARRSVEVNAHKGVSASWSGGGELFQFLHLPVQSGDDKVLERMNRGYQVSDFRRIVKEFRGGSPKITVWTDMIVGFPGETDKAFENSMRLLGEVRPDVVNISKFSARPGTAAKKMKQTPSQVIKERSKRMSQLARQIALEKNEEWIGWEGQVLIDEVGRVSGSLVGRNFAYKPVVVHGDRNLLGKFLQVKTVKATSTHLEAEVKF